jgi:hypothetical protein
MFLGLRYSLDVFGAEFKTTDFFHMHVVGLDFGTAMLSHALRRYVFWYFQSTV